MAIRYPSAVLCCIMAFLLPISTLAAESAPAGGAILTPTGMVTVNGELVKDSSALLGNETISTGPESAAHITSSGFNAILAPQTVAIYAHDSIQLKSGAISVTSRRGIYAQVGKSKFAPVVPETLTTYEVRTSECDVTVVVREGSISLPDGRVLNKGQSVQNSGDSCETAKEKGKRPAAAGWHISNTAWALIGLAAAGTGAGLALLGSGGTAAAASPARP